jgi:2-oxoglutarate ferredoxin oxidoreductase subunit alpha
MPHRSRQRFRHQVRQRQRLGLGLGQRTCSPRRSCAWACRSARATSSPQHPGLPTWYEVRVNEQGWLGRRGGIDMVVAMNPQTWPGRRRPRAGRLPVLRLHQAAARRRPSGATTSHVIGMPLTRCATRPTATRAAPAVQEHHLRRRPGRAARHRPGGDPEAARRAVPRQPQAAEPNIHALQLGYDYAKEHLPMLGLRIQVERDKVGDRIFMDGNTAAGAGRVYGGATVSAGTRSPRPPRCRGLREATAPSCASTRRPAGTTTPSCRPRTSWPPSAWSSAPAWNGARAFTATSGPGVSLMTEFLGLAYFAEIPVTLINVQRGGPSTGMPTRTQQADLLAAPMLPRRHQACCCCPQDPHRVLRVHRRQAFDLADRLQTPVFVMTDLDIGMNQRLCPASPGTTSRGYDRGKVMTAEELESGRDFGRYKDVDGDGIPYRTCPARTPPRAPTSPAAPPRTPTRGTPRRGRTTSTTCSGC